MKLAEIRRWGQARKSLWIETEALTKYLKDGEKVRLVRACGSKLRWMQNKHKIHSGQARKSLWIETI